MSLDFSQFQHTKKRNIAEFVTADGIFFLYVHRLVTKGNIHWNGNHFFFFRKSICLLLSPLIQVKFFSVRFLHALSLGVLCLGFFQKFLCLGFQQKKLTSLVLLPCHPLWILVKRAFTFPITISDFIRIPDQRATLLLGQLFHRSC